MDGMDGFLRGKRAPTAAINPGVEKKKNRPAKLDGFLMRATVQKLRTTVQMVKNGRRSIRDPGARTVCSASSIRGRADAEFSRKTPGVPTWAIAGGIAGSITASQGGRPGLTLPADTLALHSLRSASRDRGYSAP